MSENKSMNTSVPKQLQNLKALY